MGTGNPALRPAARHSSRVYPRGHGESTDHATGRGSVRGLSPWARGIQHRPARREPGEGSIPVGTGNPPPAPTTPGSTRVYPRGHGESATAARRPLRAPGLSPWARGIPMISRSSRSIQRSIPVGTGNPRPREQIIVALKVYPRGHGESGRSRHDLLAGPGLSPWARGIPPTAAEQSCAKGSIPVGTGNPVLPPSIALPLRVYPRGHGESLGRRAPPGARHGLSPWARGIPVRIPLHAAPEGSIPVGTGNPPPAPTTPGSTRVYPRGHGESDDWHDRAELIGGLSPWARGISREVPGGVFRVGSIPVGTGNPARSGQRHRGRKVYPRGHGESEAARAAGVQGVGLSPWARGILCVKMTHL